MMEHFVTDFQELKASTAEKIDKIERLSWENLMGHGTVQTGYIKQQLDVSNNKWIYQTRTGYIKQQVELLQDENNRLRMESESLLKEIELLLVQQVNTLEANDNTENFITVKETGKNKKMKLNHQQDSRIPLRNSLEILSIEEC